MTNELSQIVNNAGIAEQKSQSLLESFAGYFQEARDLAKGAKEIVVKSIDDVEQMNTAREKRLALKSVRVEVEKTRKSLKEQSLREGKAIDGIANVIKALIVPVEQHLDDQEKFAERIEAERKNKIEFERVKSLSKYVDESEGYSLHPDKMSQETFDKLLENSKIAHEARLLAKKQAEADRIAKEKAEREEQERIKKENEKLRKEAEEREAELAKERAEQQKALESERKAREEAERKERETREAEEKKIKEDEEQKRKAELAPDREKLHALAIKVANLEDELPNVSSKEAQKIKNHAESKLKILSKEILSMIGTL